MDTKHRLLKFDYKVQYVLGLIVLICCGTVVGIYFGLLLLMPFGAAQVLSGLIFGLVYGDKKRMIYLAVVAAFFLLWYARFNIFKFEYDTPLYTLGSLIDAVLCATPIILGIWYFRLTKKEYKDWEREQKASEDLINFNSEGIVDAQNIQ